MFPFTFLWFRLVRERKLLGKLRDLRERVQQLHRELDEARAMADKLIVAVGQELAFGPASGLAVEAKALSPAASPIVSFPDFSKGSLVPTKLEEGEPTVQVEVPRGRPILKG